MSVAPSSPTRPWRRAIVQVADAVYLGEAGAPPGTLGGLFATLDAMRAARADGRDIILAEHVAITLHRLRDTLRTEGKASRHAIALRTDLRRSTVAWLDDVPLADFA